MQTASYCNAILTRNSPVEDSMPLGPVELIIILVIVIVVFGAGKLSGLGAGLGKSIKDFRSEVKDGSDDKPKA